VTEDLTGRQKAEATLRAMAEDWPDFLLGHGLFKTRDEHRNDCVEPLPDLPYLRIVMQELWQNRVDQIPTLMPKSRQVMISWAVLTHILGLNLIFKHQLWLVQSKREEDAVALIDRVNFMHDHLPQWIKTIRPRMTGAKENMSKLELPLQDNKIWGIPQGPDIVRSHTMSGLFADELDFQPEARKAIRAAMPSLVGGGQFIGVSSAESGGLMSRLLTGVW